jgi:tetratricopeptide (TPR) repeat protein
MAIGSSAALAQQGGVPDMPTIAQGLGVQCQYCHAGPRAARPSAGQPSTAQAGAEVKPPSKFEIARAMIAMTRDLNAKIEAATGKPPTEATQVTCVTCHRGVAIPGQLSDIIANTALAQGADAAIAQYRDLRERYYGGQSYDFREDSLLEAGQKLIRVKPPLAIPLLRLNLEYYPKSARSYVQIAFAYTRNLDDDSAITALEKALEIEPENGAIRGQLEQLKSYHRKR